MNLSDPVSRLPFIGDRYRKRFKRLEIQTLEDLLLHIPNRYIDYSLVSKIKDLKVSQTVTVKAVVLDIKNIYTKNNKKIQLAKVSDGESTLNIVWFNQPFLIRTIQRGGLYFFSGKVSFFDRQIALISPEYESGLGGKTIHTGRLLPIYPETYGLSTKFIRARIAQSFDLLKDKISDFLPDEVLKKEKLLDLKTAITFVHFPKNINEAIQGKERLALNELLFYQLKSMHRKSAWKKNKARFVLKIDKQILPTFQKSLPFKLTNSQIRACNEILTDLAKTVPMNRLLEGDVGSGKTVVAACALFASFINGYQGILLAPTQILAQQHYETLKKILGKFKVRITLITSDVLKSDLGRTDIFIGTHALIHRNVEFDKVSLVVIDEQHRFGVEQRAHLVKKVGDVGYAPHVLTMTATPIPRTIALTVYGDLDLSTLDELPKGRIPVKTYIVPPEKRERAYEWIRKKIKQEKIQAFVICPLIENSNVETMKQVKSAVSEYEKLSKIFFDLKVGLLHGKLAKKAKEETINDFRTGKINILVSTPVVEVGIDIANATIILIEAAERFGLAQLHQLRGRVGRGDKESFCLLFTESKSDKVYSRLNALKENKSGFELAELDLKLRGPGEIYGVKQHGFPKLKIASWQDEELIKKAKIIANQALSSPKLFSKLFQKIKIQKTLPN